MNNSKNIAEFIHESLRGDRPDFVISVGIVSEEDIEGIGVRYVVAVTDKDRIYKVTVEAL